MTKTKWSDEQLSAFLDGELSSEEMGALSSDSESDSALAARLKRLSAANAAYVGASAAIDRQPMSEGLKAAMTLQPAKIVPLRRKSIGAFVVERRAVAAALICAVAVWGIASAVKYPVSESPDVGGYILASSSLHRMLERTPSSVAVELASGVSATPRLSFETQSGGVCRHYCVDSHTGRSEAIACREGGKWRVELAVFGPAGVSTGDYQAASGAPADVLDRFIDGVIAGAPLDAEEETKQIQSAWSNR